MSTWPTEVASLEAFLHRVGLRLQRREESASFGNRFVEFRGPRLGVRAVSDRGKWSVTIADLEGRDGKWYDAGIVRDLLGIRGPDVIPLADQVDFVQTHWHEVMSAFGPSRRDASHAELSRLGWERVQRRIPGLGKRP